MGAKTPEDAHRQWVEAFNAGDLDGLMNLYEREAVLCDSGGQPVSGLDAIRRGYAAILRSKPQVKVQTKYAIRMGDIALLRADWEMTGISPDGKPLHSAHHSTEVLRRQPDGTWCYVIDHPFGAD